MELSDDQKKRILEEEQQRIAEEQYRAQVRKELGSTSAAGRSGTGPKWYKDNTRAVILVIVLLVAACVGGFHCEV